MQPAYRSSGVCNPPRRWVAARLTRGTDMAGAASWTVVASAYEERGRERAGSKCQDQQGREEEEERGSQVKSSPVYSARYRTPRCQGASEGLRRPMLSSGTATMYRGDIRIIGTTTSALPEEIPQSTHTCISQQITPLSDRCFRTSILNRTKRRSVRDGARLLALDLASRPLVPWPRRKQSF